MTKKKSKSAAKEKPATKGPEILRFTEAQEKAWSLMRATEIQLDRRKELLARVAGSVAAGLVTSPSPSIASPSGMATAAVDIAEEILKKAGILPTAEAVESSSESATADVAS